ncbi:ABC-F family ATP-binding cassette domain-containing protein [Clostridium botulinum]|uniref:Putative drug resistance ABC transporter, ATP-binding protein n=1 Tax=Clostridium botulinum (strain Langeland / NCTC 10281 / Type F) TaxID=441772 RepID=A7GIP2_CLOBL|nr:ABC-F family ATP-binding cassette domain-containing protein [Clostridium botulinum]ABS40150.1 putative drug resistance ABC transporter, ATP-binding protein [Clostridium botulinum F str. Langeland]ADG01015.1 putative drug resistance ABC transporter, ATP-binding protein [Clostridium botulinum F str. 230613]KKM42112.1 thiamine ABC transporter substrate-binding protein [Clostridium botulinum]MBD5645526.1 ABC-F family ATP-binding cassette domain-containing protein [Clostridium botulinum]MBY67935
MVVLSCKNISKAYGVDLILDNLTFNINENDKVGLIGANGAGKSTLFKILTSSLEQDSGDIFIDKSKSLGYLAQHLSLDSNNTIYEEVLDVFHDLIKMEEKLNKLEKLMNEPYDKNNKEYHDKVIKDYTTYTDLYINRGGYTYKGEIHRVLRGLSFEEEDFNKQINILSGGQKTRVALCKLLLQSPDILLLDEPTNHLDLTAINWLEEYLKAYKGTVLIISHDRYFLDEITNQTFELISGHMNCYNGNYSKFIELRKKEYEVKLKAYNLQQSEIKRQEKIIEKYKSFNREKSIKAAESRQKSLDKIERIDAPDKLPKLVKISFETQIKSGNDILHIENLSKSYGDMTLFENVEMDIKRGEKIALIGDNGRGKTTLFKIIMDEIQSNSGTKYIGKNVFIGYYDQEQSDLNECNTVLDEIWDEFPEMTTTEVRNALAAFLFTGDDVFKEISKLSGGEKCKVNLLKLMLSKSNLLLLDEPTNHLDIMSREALEDALLNYDGTVLVISHDRYFLNKVIGKIYELNIDGIKEYLGNYDYYIHKKINPNRFDYEAITSENSKTKTQIHQERKKKKEEEKKLKQEKLKIKNLEKEITDLEEVVNSLQEQLCLEEVYSDSVKSEKINKDIINKQKLIEDLYSEWENFME